MEHRPPSSAFLSYCKLFRHLFTKKFMGRKTNSVSLRLKKTNRDYNNCWYGDILYAESFSKSLKINNYLSQTLKTVGMPCPQTSVIGAFKKAALLVCYLDPQKRKRLLEKSSKGMQTKARTLQTSVKNRSTIKAFLSLGKVKQDSKALLRPLQTILQTNLGPYGPTNERLQYGSEWPLKANQSSGYFADSALKADSASQKANHGFVAKQAGLEQALVSVAGHQKATIEKNKFLVKRVQQKANSLSETITTKLNYFYRGSISLDLVQNTDFAVDKACLISSQQAQFVLSFYNICNFLCLARGIETTGKKPCKGKESRTHFASTDSLFDAPGLTKNDGVNNNKTSFQSLVFSSMAHLKTGTGFSLKGSFFLKKQENIQSSACNLLELPVLKCFKNIKYQGKLYSSFLEKSVFSKKSLLEGTQTQFILQKGKCKLNHASKEFGLQTDLPLSSFTSLEFFPFFFENKKSNAKVWSRFINFSDFFQNEISNLELISAFSKNSQIFGKNKQSNHAFSRTPFSCLSEFLLNKPCSIKDFNKKKHVDVLLQKVNQRVMTKMGNLKSYNPSLYEKNENCSLTGLYSFYNGISSFWGNLACLSFYKSTNETCCALFLAECVSYLLEKKVSFRSIKRQLLLELQQSKYSLSAEKAPVLRASHFANPISGALALPVLDNKRKVTGIRITCSGRVGGRSKKAQRSRKDTFMWGETGLHVFASKLDFAKTHAETPFGLVGVQVWVCSK